MYRTIVVPLDGSDAARRALPVAAAVAERIGAEVVLVTIVSSRKPSADIDELRRLAAGLGVPARTKLEFGEDAAYLLAPLAAQEGSLLCMATRGRGAVRAGVPGSVAAAVVRDARRPVLLVGPACPPTSAPAFERILVCVDGSAHAEAVFDVAVRWARHLGMRMLLVQVVPPLAEAPTAAARIAHGYTDPEGYVAGAAQRMRAEGVKAEWTVLADEHPVQALAGLMVAEAPSLVAMATHGSTGLARVVLGSVAGGVVGAAPCPVLVVRPSGLGAAGRG